MTDAQRLVLLIRQASEDMEHIEISIDALSPEYRALGEEVCSCLRKVQEVTRFTAGMADGDLSAPVPRRENTLAGPIKDLYYKLLHLKWQASQIAQGDFSQHVDFMGSFSDAFNSMTMGLKVREDTIRTQAEEKLCLIETEQRRLRQQMDRQQAHFTAYRAYTESFQEFRRQYKQMMGEVYALFSEGKYEEGRQKIAFINDLMGKSVAVPMDYSNNEPINTALMELAAYCGQCGIECSATVHVPEGFINDEALAAVSLSHWMNLIYSMLDTYDSTDRSLTLWSRKKTGWLSIMIQYQYAPMGNAAPNDRDFLKDLQQVSEDAEKLGALFTLQRNENCSELLIALQLPQKYPPAP